MSIRVLLVDDHPLVRAGIRTTLEAAPDIVIVGEANSGAEAQQLVVELHPDVVLLDIVMPGPRAWEIERWIREHYPKTMGLVLSAHNRDAYLAEMWTAGAAGFLSKEVVGENLRRAIYAAVSGTSLFTSEQLVRICHWQEEVKQKWNSLTKREYEVLALIAEGKSNQEIAHSLQISVKTAGNHVSNILDKLDVASRTEAALWAVRERYTDRVDG